MKLVTFTEENIAKARAIAMINYNEERESCPMLPIIEQTPDLKYYAENGLGVAAFENDEMVGVLCCYEPWEEAWDSAAVGTFSPIHAHGAVKENRERIYRELYEMNLLIRLLCIIGESTSFLIQPASYADLTSAH